MSSNDPKSINQQLPQIIKTVFPTLALSGCDMGLNVKGVVDNNLYLSLFLSLSPLQRTCIIRGEERNAHFCSRLILSSNTLIHSSAAPSGGEPGLIRQAHIHHHLDTFGSGITRSGRDWAAA